MRPLFQSRLVNEPFGDPGLYVEFMFEKRALLFDIGDVRALSPRHLLRASDVFVSHAHMDHFIGFDQLLRLHLGRQSRLRIYGPPGILAQVEHKLAAYTWNLVARYDAELVFEVMELVLDGTARRASLASSAGFRAVTVETLALPGDVLRDEAGFRVRAVSLDHGTPSLGFALEEKMHVNVWKNRLRDLGLPVGPWLHELKAAILAGEAETMPVRIAWRDDNGEHERVFSLGVLRDQVLRMVPGQKIVYVTDCVYNANNARRIVELAEQADYLYIESPFLDADADGAQQKLHLTARQAGLLARRAGAKRVIPFHFSPRYSGEGARLQAEVERAWRPGGIDADQGALESRAGY